MQIARFIMSDLVNKLESVPGIRKLNQRQTLQLINYPADLVKDIVRFLPKIIDHFKQVWLTEYDYNFFLKSKKIIILNSF